MSAINTLDKVIRDKQVGIVERGDVKSSLLVLQMCHDEIDELQVSKCTPSVRSHDSAFFYGVAVGVTASLATFAVYFYS